nr:EAL domain-containing protein [Ancylobacter radicis]
MLAVTIVGVGTAVPLAATLLASWRLAVETRQDALEHRAHEVLAHAEAVYAEAAATLRSIASTDFSTCSPGHVRWMRELDRISLVVDNIAYGAREIVECNTFGPMMRRMVLSEIAERTVDGIGLVVNWSASHVVDRPTLIMSLGGHHVLVDQQRFLGFPHGHLQAELRTAGGIPLATRPPSRYRSAVLLAAAPVTADPVPSGSDASAGAAVPGAVAATDEAEPPEPSPPPLTATAASPRWKVTVHEPPLGFLAHIEGQRRLLLPLGAVLAILFAGASIWMLRQRLSPRGELAAAVRQREFVAHYQPIIELSTGRCVGAEALVRWRRPNGQLVRPDLFIPLAEETGLIRAITDQMIGAVIEDLGAALVADPRLHVAINICAEDLSTGRVLGVLEEALAGTGICSNQIWLEATERGFVDIEGTHATLAKARARGHFIAIDDFGTGYSGLRYLQRLPIDALKIDKSFIDVVGTEAPTSHVTEHILALARELHLTVVAEGVERPEQADYLRQSGVQMAQGWLFSRALPADAYLAFCRINRAQYGAPCNVVPFQAA